MFCRRASSGAWKSFLEAEEEIPIVCVLQFLIQEVWFFTTAPEYKRKAWIRIKFQRFCWHEVTLYCISFSSLHTVHLHTFIIHCICWLPFYFSHRSPLSMVCRGPSTMVPSRDSNSEPLTAAQRATNWAAPYWARPHPILSYAAPFLKIIRNTSWN